MSNGYCHPGKAGGSPHPLETVNRYSQSQGVKITTGAIVDAAILHAPSSTKSREQKHDEEMHQTNVWSAASLHAKS
jgi:hypothetical protein